MKRQEKGMMGLKALNSLKVMTLLTEWYGVERGEKERLPGS
jgi:hypothetical protein